MLSGHKSRQTSNDTVVLYCTWVSAPMSTQTWPHAAPLILLAQMIECARWFAL